MQQLGVAFTVANLEIDYRSPARLDDELEVQTTVPQIRSASISFEQALRRSGQAPVLARGRVRVACVESREIRQIALHDVPFQAIRWDRRSGGEGCDSTVGTRWSPTI